MWTDYDRVLGHLLPQDKKRVSKKRDFHQHTQWTIIHNQFIIAHTMMFVPNLSASCRFSGGSL
jgi:type IV secretory pathway VirD2 relaxase